MRRRRAPRRPEYGPGGQWCCRICQEMHQLNCAAITGPTVEDRLLAASFRLYVADIANGKYLGVQLGNLFD